MKKLMLVAVGAGAVLGGVEWWRRHPRFGTRFVNEVVNPWLVRRGIVDRSKAELAIVEHVGRRSGTVRLVPVHPEVTADGYRIMVPLGLQSEWARNVVAAGHCRMQVGETIHELDEPALLPPSVLADIPAVSRSLMTWLGFRYLVLHRVAERPGTLTGPAAAVAAGVPTIVGGG